MNLLQAAFAAQQQRELLPTISMEQELLELGMASEASAGIEIDLAETDRANALVDALEDLQFVIDGIQGTPTNNEAALIQIVGDTAAAGSGVDGSALTPALEDGEVKPTNIGEKIKAIVAAIMENLRAVMKKLGQFIHSYTTVAGNTRRRYDAVGERLKTAKESSSTETIRMDWARPGELARNLDELERHIVDFIGGNQNTLRQLASVVQSFADGAPRETSRKQVALLESLKPGHGYVKSQDDQNGTSLYLSKSQLGRFVFGYTKVEDTFAVYGEGSDRDADDLLHIVRFVGYHIDRNHDVKPVDEVPLPKIFELKAIYKGLSGIVDQLTMANDKNKLLGAAEVRRDFQERFTEQVLSKLSRDNPENMRLASGVSAAINAMTATSTVPYTRLIQECSYIVNATLRAINRALDVHEAALKAAEQK